MNVAWLAALEAVVQAAKRVRQAWHYRGRGTVAQAMVDLDRALDNLDAIVGGKHADSSDSK